MVLRVGRTPVGSPAALDRELGEVKAGQTVMLLVRRGGATQFVAVTPRTTAGNSRLSGAMPSRAASESVQAAVAGGRGGVR